MAVCKSVEFRWSAAAAEEFLPIIESRRGPLGGDRG